MGDECGHGHGGHECSGHRFDNVKEQRRNERTVSGIKQMLRGKPEGLKPEQIARLALGFKFAPREASASLIRGLLGGREEFEYENGRWRIAESEFMALDVVPFVIVDVETTGGRSTSDRLIELAAFTVTGGSISSSIMTLINPDRPIPPEITSLTGIRDKDVEYSPRAADILPRFVNYLGDAVFVAHNARFDFSFINAELQRCGVPALKNEVLCTVKLARRVFPGEPSYGLDNLIKMLKLDLDPAERHRGHGDAWATSELLIRCLGTLRNAGMTSLDELLHFQQMRPPLARKKYGLED